jgi:hypothetical protein
VGVITCVKGRIVFSTLDIANQLDAPADNSTLVARKLLCNFITFGNQTSAPGPRSN